jgi:hypothetical protein
MAEIIPFEPDPGNAGVGISKWKIKFKPYPGGGQRDMAFLVRLQFRKHSVSELVSRTYPA